MTIGSINKKVSGGMGSVGGECHLGEVWQRNGGENSETVSPDHPLEVLVIQDTEKRWTVGSSKERKCLF